MAVFGPERFQLKSGVAIMRHCLPEDAALFPAFYSQIASETHFTMMTLSDTPAVDKAAEYWQQCLTDPGLLRLGAFDGDKIIGQLGFKPLTPPHPWTAHVAFFGMMILKDYWGQGIGRRMLEIMDEHAKKNGFTRIEAKVRVKNERGVKLYRNAGYQIEGTRRQAALIDGEYWDEFFIAKLLRPRITTSIKTPKLETKRLILRLPTEDDAPEIIRYFHENEAHFAPTNPPRPNGFFTENYWKEHANKAYEEFTQQQSVRFFLFDRNNEREVIGSTNFTQFFHSPFHACYLGYAISKRHEGQGLMAEALKSAIEYVFEERNIHRIMANHLPENDRSAWLLARLGFIVEGLAKNYLFINGEWRDHVLTSLTNQTWMSK